ncbi:hypothetical protein ABVN80_03075 [Acinetobacter baumannii]
MLLRIVIRVNEEEMVAGEAGVDIYNLIKYTRSNQNTCINQKCYRELWATKLLVVTSCADGLVNRHG